MNKGELLETLRAERAAWEALLREVGEARMILPGVAGEWSLKDVVSHVTAYERWLVEWLEAAARGSLPPSSELENPDVEARNAFIFARNRDRPLEDVLEESRQVFGQLLESVAVLSEDDLNDAQRTAWFVMPYWKEKRPLWKCIAGDSYEHYHQHTDSIRRWLEGLD